MTSSANPFFVALCGWPKSGKDEVAKILAAQYGAVILDDGWAMRDFAIRHLGATRDDVLTQEGKTRRVVMPGGQEMSWREFLGDMCKALEGVLGPQCLPEIAILGARAMMGDTGRSVFCAPSVRRGGGWGYRRHGGMVIEIERPGYGDSGNDFDRWDAGAVTHRLSNDSTLENLRTRVLALVDDAYARHQAGHAATS